MHETVQVIPPKADVLKHLPPPVHPVSTVPAARPSLHGGASHGAGARARGARGARGVLGLGEEHHGQAWRKWNWERMFWHFLTIFFGGERRGQMFEPWFFGFGVEVGLWLLDVGPSLPGFGIVVHSSAVRLCSCLC